MHTIHTFHTVLWYCILHTTLCILYSLCNLLSAYCIIHLLCTLHTLQCVDCEWCCAAHPAPSSFLVGLCNPLTLPQPDKFTTFAFSSISTIASPPSLHHPATASLWQTDKVFGKTPAFAFAFIFCILYLYLYSFGSFQEDTRMILFQWQDFICLTKNMFILNI